MMTGKLKNLLDKYGAARTFVLLGRYASGSVRKILGPARRDRETVDALLGEIREGQYERIILRRGSFGWHTPLFQRAQHLARAAAQKGCLVLYEAAAPHDCLRGVEKLGERLWLVNLRSPRLRRMIERAAAESARPRYVMVASTESRLSVRSLEAYTKTGWDLIYDYIDAISAEISGGGGVPRRTRALFRWAMSGKDVTVTASAETLFRDALERGKKVSLVENGVDFAFFSRRGPCPEDARFRALLQEGRPILCYYGALAEWLDYAALRALAADGRFALLLIGVRYDGSFDRELAGKSNVLFLGQRPYETLKDYAARCDVLLVTFRKGEVGDAASPVKLFEYLSLEKPIVAGDTAECRRCRSALIAADEEDYVRCVEKALSLRGDEAYRSREREEALAADWQRRAAVLCRALRKREKNSPKSMRV